MTLFIDTGEMSEGEKLKKQLQAEQWAQTIRLNEELILHPFSHEIVKTAIHHFGSKHRPWMPYAHDEYDVILVADSEAMNGYGLYDPEEDWSKFKVPGTWREWAKERGQSMEDLAAEWDLEEELFDAELDSELYFDSLGPIAGPQGSAYLILERILGTYQADFPIGSLSLIAGDSPMNSLHYAEIRPKVALTFLQIYLDWKEIGIKIVLEEEWMKMKEAPHE
ncbi:MAG: hypothetical protein DRJ61_07735 [Acidobacteria bacterium]|nr:MAG: hypothetical protein DRJ61_07735 [Acidobacteriota bacterium]